MTRSERSSSMRPSIAFLLVVFGLWSPFVVPFFLECQRDWMLSHVAVLPGLPVAVNLGAKGSDWGLAGVMTAALVVVLFLLARRRPYLAAGASLLLGGFFAVVLYGRMQM